MACKAKGGVDLCFENQLVMFFVCFSLLYFMVNGVKINSYNNNNNGVIMKGNIFINAVCVCLMGLVCFGALGDVAYAGVAPSAMPAVVIALDACAV